MPFCVALEIPRQIKVMLDLGKGFRAQLRGHFENLLRTIAVTKNLYDLITISVPQHDAIF